MDFITMHHLRGSRLAMHGGTALLSREAHEDCIQRSQVAPAPSEVEGDVVRQRLVETVERGRVVVPAFA
jgi:hypothetical protein